MRLLKRSFAWKVILAALSLALPGISQAACAPASGTLCPVTVFQNVQDFVVGALQVLVTVSLPIIGFFIVFVGYQFIAAQGNGEKLRAAKKNFMYVIIGAGLILGAWVLATLIGSTVSQLIG